VDRDLVAIKTVFACRNRLYVRDTADAICSKTFLLSGHGMIETVETWFGKREISLNSRKIVGHSLTD
jgi:hypothetical protein